MGAPSTSTQSRDTASAVADGEPLGQIGSILAALHHQDEESGATASRALEARRAFLDDFQAACTQEVRPAMQAVLDELRLHGGDGLIEEHPGGEPRVATPRISLWMSLLGPLEGSPRADRHPYLQLDADVDHRLIRVTEGDFREGLETGHSGSAGAWKPGEVTRAAVIRESVDIVRRSAHITAV